MSERENENAKLINDTPKLTSFHGGGRALRETGINLLEKNVSAKGRL